jgi:hypothetical protein
LVTSDFHSHINSFILTQSFKQDLRLEFKCENFDSTCTIF